MAGKLTKKSTLSKVKKTITKKGKTPKQAKAKKHVIKPRKIAPAVPTDSKSKISNDGILTDELPLTVKSSKKGGKANVQKDFYTEMLRYTTDQKISDSDLNDD